MHKKVSYGGMATALSVILLIMSAYLPSGRAAALFLASVVVYIMGIITDKKTALVTYVASTVLSFLLVSSALSVLLSYGICFGNYPVIKSYLENGKSLVIRIVSKTVLYTLYFFTVYLTFVYIAGFTIPYAVYVLYVGGIFVFAFYDWLLLRTGVYVLKRFFKSF